MLDRLLLTSMQQSQSMLADKQRLGQRHGTDAAAVCMVAGMLRHIPVIGEENAGWRIRLVDMDIVHDGWQGDFGPTAMWHLSATAAGRLFAEAPRVLAEKSSQ